jgi:hypothetical protein
MPLERSGTRLRHWALVGLLGAGLVVVYTWPLARGLDRLGRSDSHDGQYGLWQAAWVAHAILTDPLHVYDANIFYPHRTTLAFSEPVLLAGILGLPAFAATGSAYATHNLAVLAFFLLSFLSAYALGRHLTGQAIPAIAFGVSYGFCPYVFARTAQLPMMAVFGLPLSLLAMHRLVERPSFRTALALAGALFLQALACGYYTIFALLIVSAGLVYFGLLSSRWKDRTFRRCSAVALALTVAVLLPLFWPHVRLAQVEGFSRPVDEAYRFAADWRAWFASSAWAHRWMLPLLGTWNEVLFPGFLVIGLAIAGAWLGLRARLQGAAVLPVSPRALAGFYVLLGVLAGWLAFGPAGGLYLVMYEAVPLFSFIRSAGRFGVVVTLAAGALMTLALAHLRVRLPHGRLVAVVLTGLVAAELFSAPRSWTPARGVSAVYRTLAVQPAGPVMEFPMFPGRLENNAQYVLTSAAHWQPLVNGYGAFWPADIQRLANETEAFPSEETLAIVRAWGVRYVVVHVRMYERYGLSSEAALLTALAGLEARMKLLSSDKDIRLYEIRDWTPRRP